MMPTPVLYAGSGQAAVHRYRRRPAHAVSRFALCDRSRSARPIPRRRALYCRAARGISHSGRRSSNSATALPGTLSSRKACRPTATSPIDLQLGERRPSLGRFPRHSLRDRAHARQVFRERPTSSLRTKRRRAHSRPSSNAGSRVAPRKEVVLFVHGFANTFEDAALTTGELCHFLGREFVCVVFTWPAGGSKIVYLRLRRRPRVGRVRGGGPEEDDPHDRGYARSGEDPSARAQPRHRSAGDGRFRPQRRGLRHADASRGGSRSATSCSWRPTWISTWLPQDLEGRLRPGPCPTATRPTRRRRPVA